MGQKLMIFAFAILFSRVNSQRCGCGPPIVPATQLIPPPLMPATQVVSPPVVATTIVDNSVSNALANALQLLIVSDLIESTLAPALAAGNILSAPILENVATPYGSALEIISPQEYAPCAQNIELLPPCRSPIVETIQPNIYGGYTETFAPLYGPPAIIEKPNLCGGITEFSSLRNGPIVERIQPNYFGGVTEFSPVYGNPVVERFQPNIYGGISETITPLCSGPVVETIQPNIFGGITETLSSLYGPQLVEQFLPNPYGYTEVCGINEFNPGFYNGVTEIITPPCSLSSPVVTPGYFERITEVVPPTAQFLPNYYGGVTEVFTPPMAAEVMIPSAIPAQLTCNFGYNLPSNTPCVSVNVEALPFEACGCNNCVKNYYY